MERCFLVSLACVVSWSCSSREVDAPLGVHSQALSSPSADAIGLSLRIDNGSAAPLSLLDDTPRFVQELDIVEAVPTATDAGIDPLIQAGAWSQLDWTGVTQVEEIWVPGLDGTFTRERYYRNARWM